MNWTPKQINITEQLDNPNLDITKRKKILTELNQTNQSLLVYFFFNHYLRKLLRKHFAKNEVVKILEIGSGSGGLAKNILSKFKDSYQVDYTLCDVDIEILKWAKQNCAEDSHDVKTLWAEPSTFNTLLPNSYDLIISLHTIHHIHPAHDVITLFNSLIPVTKKGFLIVDFHRKWGNITLLSFISRILFISNDLLSDGFNSLKRSYSRDELVSFFKYKHCSTKIKTFFWNPYLILELEKN